MILCELSSVNAVRLYCFVAGTHRERSVDTRQKIIFVEPHMRSLVCAIHTHTRALASAIEIHTFSTIPRQCACEKPLIERNHSFCSLRTNDETRTISRSRRAEAHLCAFYCIHNSARTHTCTFTHTHSRTSKFCSRPLVEREDRFVVLVKMSNPDRVKCAISSKFLLLKLNICPHTHTHTLRDWKNEQKQTLFSSS